MRNSRPPRGTFLLLTLFLAAAAQARSHVPSVQEAPPPIAARDAEDAQQGQAAADSLPTTLSPEQLQFLMPLASAGEPASLPRPQLHHHPQLHLSEEAAAYKLVVEKLGADRHRFVHCELKNGRVHTGVIASIKPTGFVLKDGILFDRWISYSDLTAAPRHVAAVGTRIGHGFEWAGLILVTIPLLPFAFLFWDGC